MYATADAGHSLSDARALLGNGVRPLGHLPGFPFLTAIARFFFGDLTSFRVLAVVVAALLPLAFYVFIRGRTGSDVGDLVATALFGVALPSAEGVGWYGLPMLLGVAMSLVALRRISDWMVRPGPRTALVAGIWIGATALTHTVPFLWLAETSLVVVGIEVFIELFKAERRERLRRRLWSAGLLVAFVIASSAASLLYLGRFESPVSLGWDLSNLSFIWRFGFRDNQILWMPALVLGLVAPILLIRHRGPRARLAYWAAAGGAMACLNLVLFRGDPSYETRMVYVLATCACVGVAICIAQVQTAALIRSKAWGIQVFVATACLVPLAAVPSFADRLNIVVPFYNRVDRSQIEAIRWLGRHQGAVVIGGSPEYFYAGATLSWLVWGVADRQAFAAIEGYRSLDPAERRESADATRFFAGDEGVEASGLMVGVTRNGSSALLLGRFDGGWLPLARVTTSASDNQDSVPDGVSIGSGGRITISGSGRATLSGSSSGAFTLAAPTGAEVLEIRGGTVTIRSRSSGKPVLTVRRTDGGPSPVAEGPVAVFAERGDGRRFSAELDARRISKTNPTPRRFEATTIQAKRNIRFAWVWAGSAEADVLASRGASVVFRSGDVTIFDLEDARTPAR